MTDTDRDYYQEAIGIVTSDVDLGQRATVEYGHLRALWDIECAMTLRLAEVHARAQAAEAERDRLRAQLREALSDLEEVLGVVAVEQPQREPVMVGGCEGCEIEGRLDPDPMTLAKADLEAKGER